MRLKTIIATLALTLTVGCLINATAAAAGSYTYVSGPNGGVLRNGWYLYNEGGPTITINAGPGSTCGGTGTFTLGLAPGGGDSMGEHTLRYFYVPSDPKNDLWVSRDGTVLVPHPQ